jgi:hypothetical protein
MGMNGGEPKLRRWGEGRTCAANSSYQDARHNFNCNFRDAQAALQTPVAISISVRLVSGSAGTLARLVHVGAKMRKHFNSMLNGKGRLEACLQHALAGKCARVPGGAYGTNRRVPDKKEALEAAGILSVIAKRPPSPALRGSTAVESSCLPGDFAAELACRRLTLLLLGLSSLAALGSARHVRAIGGRGGRPGCGAVSDGRCVVCGHGCRR